MIDIPSHNVFENRRLPIERGEIQRISRQNLERILREANKEIIKKQKPARKNSFKPIYRLFAKTTALTSVFLVLSNPFPQFNTLEKYANNFSNELRILKSKLRPEPYQIKVPEIISENKNVSYSLIIVPEMPTYKKREIGKDFKNVSTSVAKTLSVYRKKIKNFILNLPEELSEPDTEGMEEEIEQTDEKIIEEFIAEEKHVDKKPEEPDYLKYIKKPYKFDKRRVLSLAKALQKNPEGVLGTLIAEEIKKFEPGVEENKGRIATLERTIRKAEKEIPEIKYILAQYNVDEESAYLPIVESAWNSNAISRKDAVGLWQFMEETAQAHGLTILKKIVGYNRKGKPIEEIVYDERLNPVLSTIAAAKYLSHLEKILCNKDLAIKAFNAGSKKFQSFVDKNNCENISLTEFLASRGRKIENWYINVRIKNGYNLMGIMKKRGIPWKKHHEIMEINGMTNPNELQAGRVLHIPFEFAEKFKAKTPESILENVEYIAKYRAMIHVLKTQFPEFYSLKPSNGFGVYVVSQKFREHVVKKGEHPWKIAQQYAKGGYKELVKNIRLTNGNVLSAGQKIQIPSSANLLEFALYNKHNLAELKSLNPHLFASGLLNERTIFEKGMKIIYRLNPKQPSQQI